MKSGDRIFLSKTSPIAALICAALFSVLIQTSTLVEANTAANVVKEFQQPDGQTLSLHLWGNEHANGFETLDGYTVIKNMATGNWEYAILNEFNQLSTSGHVVGADDTPPGINKFLRPAPRPVNPPVVP